MATFSRRYCSYMSTRVLTELIGGRKIRILSPSVSHLKTLKRLSFTRPPPRNKRRPEDGPRELEFPDPDGNALSHGPTGDPLL